MKYQDEWGNVLVPTKKYGLHAPQADQIDCWTGVVACDLMWEDTSKFTSDQRFPGSVGRYWTVLQRTSELTRLEWIA
jgi:hypothetical protein